MSRMMREKAVRKTEAITLPTNKVIKEAKRKINAITPYDERIILLHFNLDQPLLIRVLEFLFLYFYLPKCISLLLNI
jgi:hypothetical protein